MVRIEKEIEKRLVSIREARQQLRPLEDLQLALNEKDAQLVFAITQLEHVRRDMRELETHYTADQAWIHDLLEQVCTYQDYEQALNIVQVQRLQADRVFESSPIRHSVMKPPQSSVKTSAVRQGPVHNSVETSANVSLQRCMLLLSVSFILTLYSSKLANRPIPMSNNNNNI